MNCKYIYILNQSHATLFLNLFTATCFGCNANHYQAFYEGWYRKNYILRKKILSFPLKINYKCTKPFQYVLHMKDQQPWMPVYIKISKYEG